MIKAASSPSTKKPIRVLHVDDDAFFLGTAKRFLEAEGQFFVENTSSVSEAIKKLKQEKYDAILSDYQMPQKNGLEFLEEIRSNGNLTPFILVTVREKIEVFIKALNLGVFRYVEKHGEPKRVFADISNAIQQVYSQRYFQGGLHENEEGLRAIYNNQQSGIIVIEPSTHTIVGANRAALDLIGARREQLIGGICHNLICPTERGK